MKLILILHEPNKPRNFILALLYGEEVLPRLIRKANQPPLLKRRGIKKPRISSGLENVYVNSIISKKNTSRHTSASAQ